MAGTTLAATVDATTAALQRLGAEFEKLSKKLRWFDSASYYVRHRGAKMRPYTIRLSNGKERWLMAKRRSHARRLAFAQFQMEREGGL